MRRSIAKLVDTLNGFCPTGKGGGKKNSCGSGKGLKVAAKAGGGSGVTKASPPRAKAKEMVRLHNELAGKYHEVFKKYGVRMSARDLANRYKPSEEAEAIDHMTGVVEMGWKGFGPYRPLTERGNFRGWEKLTASQWKSLKSDVDSLHKTYSAKWRDLGFSGIAEVD